MSLPFLYFDTATAFVSVFFRPFISTVCGTRATDFPVCKTFFTEICVNYFASNIFMKQGLCCTVFSTCMYVKTIEAIICICNNEMP